MRPVVGVELTVAKKEDYSLRQLDHPFAKPMRFILLTATRAMKPARCGGLKATWTIPAARHKRGLAMEIPFTPRSLGGRQRIGNLGASKRNLGAAMLAELRRGHGGS